MATHSHVAVPLSVVTGDDDNKIGLSILHQLLRHHAAYGCTRTPHCSAAAPCPLPLALLAKSCKLTVTAALCHPCLPLLLSPLASSDDNDSKVGLAFSQHRHDDRTRPRKGHTQPCCRGCQSSGPLLEHWPALGALPALSWATPNIARITSENNCAWQLGYRQKNLAPIFAAHPTECHE